MECEIIFQIKSYDSQKQEFNTKPESIGKIDEQEELDLNKVVDYIMQLSDSKRATLAASLKAAKAQTLTNKDIVEKSTFVSNITLEELAVKYPNIKEKLSGLRFQPEDNFTLIFCHNMKINDNIYFGRTLDPSGKEIFFVNGKFGAEQLAAYLEAKSKINLVFNEQGELAEELLSKQKSNIEALELKYKNKFKHYKGLKTILLDYLNNKSAYKLFKDLNGKLINPQRILSSLIYDITGAYDAETRKSDLRLALEGIKSTGKSKYDWVVTGKNLYDVLSNMDLIDLSQDDFNKLSQDELNNLLSGIFKQDPKLIRAKVSKVEGGQSRTVQQEDSRKKISDDVVKKTWSEFKKRHSDIEYPPFTKLTELQFLRDAFAEIHPEFENLEVEMSNGKIKASYLKKGEVQEKTTTKKITLSFPYSSIGDVYDCAYDTKNLFLPVNEDDVVNGEYEGGYIYKYFDKKTNTTHYAVSRHIISPNAYMSSYSSLVDAKEKIKSWKNTLKINEYGMYTLKSKLNEDGGNRVVRLEEEGILPGQIITVHSTKLPYVDISKMSPILKTLFNGTIQNFQDTVSAWNIENTNLLNSADLASSFIISLQKFIETTSETADDKDVMSIILKNKKSISKMILDIVNSPKVSYKVENISTSRTKTGKIQHFATLRILKHNGTDVQVEGGFDNMAANQLTVGDMTRAVEYFNNLFGISVKTLTKSELIEFNKTENLDLTDFDSVRAFVYNGDIYINSSNANLSDLFHEMSHIFLGLLKVKYPDSYAYIINKYTQHAKFKDTLLYLNKKYKKFSQQDRYEEAVVNIIAKEMFNKNYMLHGFAQEEFIEDFKKLFSFSEIVQDSQDTDLNFEGFIKSLTNDKNNLNQMQKNMKISQLVNKLIKEGKIKEINC